MDDLIEVSRLAEQYARDEIRKYGMPSMLQFELSLNKGIQIAKSMNADINIVKIGISLMDLKLGESFQEKRQNEHVLLSSQASNDFLMQFPISDSLKASIINCVDAHHGNTPYTSYESEICANADCYRFIHPKGVFYYFAVLDKRLNDFDKELDQVEIKLDEKMKIVSIPIVRDELYQYYKTFKEYISVCRQS